MQVFIMHVGYPGNIDIEYTVTKTRNIQELIKKLPQNAPERKYFENDQVLHTAFPEGNFNCWGVPNRAEPSFQKTGIGDLVLIVPSIGLHEGGVHQIGIIKAICPIKCYEASRILWPHTPYDRLFPFIFFFDTEVGYRGWFELLNDLDIKENWNPKGWYRKIAMNRFYRWNGPFGYLSFLRKNCGFAPFNK